MPLFLFGINHCNAALHEREHIACSAADAPELMSAFMRLPAVSEVMILSTCHRTEWLVVSEVIEPAQEWLGNHYQHTVWQQKHYAYQDRDAVDHLLRVACGMDSVIVGEPEILGQLKEAYRLATEHSAIGSSLNQVIESVLAACKRIRHRAALGTHSLSMAQIAWQWVRQLWDDLPHRRILLLGAGAMNRLVLKYAAAHEVGHCVVMSRQLSSATRLAESMSGAVPTSAAPLAHLPECLTEVDAVISATSHPLPVITRSMVLQAMTTRRHRPLLLIDLAVPRDIEPGVEECSDVFVHHLDDMQQVLDQHQASRHAQLSDAMPLLSPAVDDIMAQRHLLRANKALQSYRHAADAQCQAALDAATAQLQAGVAAHEVLQSMTQQLAQKLLHEPTVRLRELAAAGHWSALQHALHTLTPQPEEP
jgi:glutamyl-tRNA reductase